MIWAGSLAAAIGSFMPWLTGTAPFVGTVTRSGVDDGGDGLFVVGLAAIAALWGLRCHQSSPTFKASLAFFAVPAIIAVILAMDYRQIQERKEAATELAEDGPFDVPISVSVGSGFYLAAFGAFAIFVGAGRQMTKAA